MVDSPSGVAGPPGGARERHAVPAPHEGVDVNSSESEREIRIVWAIARKRRGVSTAGTFTCPAVGSRPSLWVGRSTLRVLVVADDDMRDSVATTERDVSYVARWLSSEGGLCRSG
jgi:hypothetical protein